MNREQRLREVFGDELAEQLIAELRAARKREADAERPVRQGVPTMKDPGVGADVSECMWHPHYAKQYRRPPRRIPGMADYPAANIYPAP